MTVDFRSRSGEDIQQIDAAVFFGRTLPDLLREGEPYITPWLQANSPGPLTLEVDGQCWQLAWQGGKVHAAVGANATGLHVRLASEDFAGLLNDLYTPVTFFAGGNLDIPRGELGEFMDWWLVLRALLDRRMIHMPGAVSFEDAEGTELDLTRSFSIDDPVPEMRHFLETAGFLHLAGVFTEAEMEAISADMDRFQGHYTEGDHKSWWATTGSGERRLVRMQGFDQLSSASAQLLVNPRFQRIGEITGDGHRHSGLQDNNIEALVKPLDVVQGISDLPWHKDCSLGRHSYDCCSLTVGISVTGAGPGSGQLKVIAGSHRALMWPALISDPEKFGLPIIELPTRTGDVTVHLSCTHHMSQAPTECERRVLYTGFRLPGQGVDSGDSSRARISRVREGAYRTVSQ
jgi:hypothetical protein